MRHLVNDPVPRPRPSDYDPAWERVKQEWAEADAEAELQRVRDRINAHVDAHPIAVEDMTDEELLAAISPEPEPARGSQPGSTLEPEPLAPPADQLTPEPKLKRGLFDLPRPRSILRPEEG